jgi:hypothetical protein
MYNGKRTPGWVVFLGFIFFFPLGIYFLHRRLTEDKTESLRNSKIVSVIGWILVSLGVLYISLLFTTDNNAEGFTSVIIAFIFLGGIFIVPGLRILYGARKMKQKGMRYHRYYHIINGKVSSIAEIARSVVVPPKVALTDIQEMIDCGFFPGAYIDLNRQEIILPGSQNNIHQVILNQANQKEKRKKAINCPNCGANGVVTEGTATECEYCGTPLAF